MDSLEELKRRAAERAIIHKKRLAEQDKMNKEREPEIKAAQEKHKKWAKAHEKALSRVKHKSVGSVAWPETDEQKREHQSRFKRAWND